MPNTKSAIRRVRRVKKQTQINRIRKSKYKNAVKQMELLLKSKDKAKIKKYFPKFQSILMQVAKSGVVNKKTAARKISKVSKKIKEAGMSSIVDLKNHNLNYKIRDHSLAKIPLLLICGKKEVDSNSVTIRRLDSNKQENMGIDQFLKTFSALNKASSN